MYSVYRDYDYNYISEYDVDSVYDYGCDYEYDDCYCEYDNGHNYKRL